MKLLFLTISKNLFWLPLGFLSFSFPANAFQVDITSVDTTFISGGNSGTANGIDFAGEQLRVDSFSANGSSWETAISATSFIRRNNRGGTVPDDNLIWVEQIDSPTNLRGPIPTTTEAALNGNNLYAGSDNLFVNAGETNQSSIERVDYVLDSTTTVSSSRGLTVFERGNDNAHDSFQVALILGVDGNDNPTSFSDFLNINANTWGQTNLELNTSANRSILRDDNGDEIFAETAATSQNLGGVVITLDSFTEGGSAITDPVFGYALFGGDVDGTSPDIANVTSSAYPLSNSGVVQGELGLDPVALNFGLVQEVPFEFSPGVGLLLSGVGFLGLKVAKGKKLEL